MTERDYEHDRLSYLFLCVIVQAVKDAFFAKDKKKKVLKSGRLSRMDSAEHDRRQAIYWLCSDKEDFFTVCYFAKVSPMRIRQKAQELVDLPIEERRQRVNDLMRDCYEWNKSSANKGKSKKYL